MSIGYANKPGKAHQLSTAGADAVIRTPTAITEQIAPPAFASSLTPRHKLLQCVVAELASMGSVSVGCGAPGWECSRLGVGSSV